LQILQKKNSISKSFDGYKEANKIKSEQRKDFDNKNQGVPRKLQSGLHETIFERL
jgi:hypothetical protein